MSLSTISIHWTPYPDIFTIPFIGHPVKWYGVCFVMGFIFGYFILAYLFKVKYEDDPQFFKSKNTPPFSSGWEFGTYLTDRMLWFIVAGAIIGARLGHVFFYAWPHYQHHLLDIFKVWEGGLASHGGAIGVLIGLFLYQRLIRKELPQLTFLVLLDFICIPTALVGGFIRIANFINQEIIGTPSDKPWAVLYMHGIDGIPRHPVQLYEALAYFAVFVFLLSFWLKKRKQIPQGLIIGLFFTLMFLARFILEYFKEPQSEMMDESIIQTGQLLSIPFFIAGICLLICVSSKKITGSGSA